MAASVRIEDEAFSDRRYDRLAVECGLADADHARGKMAVLWRQCTLEQRYVLPVEDVVSILGPSAVQALISARLGSKVRHGIRIAGTKGRIEWLKKLRENGAKGGRPRKPEGLPSGSTELNPPAPAPAPAQKTEDPPNPPSGGNGVVQKRERKGREKKPRPRNELFDAIAAVTGTDPATVGSRIGKICAALGGADRPYTAADVMEFGRRWPEFFRMAKPGDRPTLSQLEEHIGKLRTPDGGGPAGRGHGSARIPGRVYDDDPAAPRTERPAPTGTPPAGGPDSPGEGAGVGAG